MKNNYQSMYMLKDISSHFKPVSTTLIPLERVLQSESISCCLNVILTTKTIKCPTDGKS